MLLKSILRVIYKPLFFLGIIFILQWFLGTYVPGPGEGQGVTFPNLQLLNTYLERPLDVLYLGDSTIEYRHKGDTDRRSIVRMLRDMVPGLRVKRLTHAAYQLDVYAAYCRYIVSCERRHKPRFVIIPINMRSFSPHWDMKPEYQFEREKIILMGGLRHVFYRPLRIFKYKFDKTTRERYLDTPVFKGDLRVGMVKGMAGRRNQLILRYMYSLIREHRKVVSLIDIVRCLFAHGIGVILYVTPLDYETGEKYLPGEFRVRVRENIRFIEGILRESNHELLDFSMDLPGSHFAWKPHAAPNEHMNQRGRMYVAQQLARRIKK